MPEITGEINCEIVPMANKLWQWRDKSTITCVDPVTSTTKDGHYECIEIDGEWKYRGAYVSQDQPKYRTYGDVVGESVADEDIYCLGTDYTDL